MYPDLLNLTVSKLGTYPATTAPYVPPLEPTTGSTLPPGPLMTTPEPFYTTKATYQTTDRVDQTTFAEGRKKDALLYGDLIQTPPKSK